MSKKLVRGEWLNSKTTNLPRWWSTFLPKLGNSSCGSCGLPWWATESHTTMYTDSWGCFPLCERCWSEKTIDERAPYYANMLNERHKEEGYVDSVEANAIMKAVLNGY